MRATIQLFPAPPHKPVYNPCGGRGRGTPYPNVGYNQGRPPYLCSLGQYVNGCGGSPPPFRGPGQANSQNYGYGPTYGPRQSHLDPSGSMDGGNYSEYVSTQNHFFPLRDREVTEADYDQKNDM